MEFDLSFKTDIDIQDEFIKKYMVNSNAGYFVTMLYTLRRVINGDIPKDFSEIAENIEFITENDVSSAFKYFEQKGFVKYEENLITFVANKSEVTLDEQKFYEQHEENIEQKRVYGIKEIELYRKNDESFSNLFVLAEKSFGRTLVQSDMFIILDMYDRLMLPVEVIEYLLEHYTAKGFTNMKYMEKVAMEWHDKDIKTREEAMKLVNAKNEDYMRVRKALGMMSKRDKTYAEEKMLDKFYNEYGYNIDVILEGCDAAVMSSKESPSYNYLEGILSNWFNEGVKTVEDVKKRFNEMEQNRKTNNKAQKVQKSPKRNKFANFTQNSVDFSEYEKMERQRLEKIVKGEDING